FEELRHYCRNPRCRTKLAARVSNPPAAFCCRGCFDSFYLHRCLVCEQPIEQPKRGRRLICRKPACRRAFRDNCCGGRYLPSSPAKLISEVPNFIGSKGAPNPDRSWRLVVAEPQLSASAFQCATLGGEEAVEVVNRTNLRHWRNADGYRTRQWGMR